MEIKDKSASYQTKNINIRVSPYLYEAIDTIAKANDISISDYVRSTLNERLMQSRKTKRGN